MDEKQQTQARADAHKKLDEILDAKDDWEWRWPLVVTVVVESPGMREAVRKLRGY